MRNQVLSTVEFSYKNRVFSAFASDLNPSSFERMFLPINPPAKLQGFNLASHVTGKTITMILNKPHYDGEGDLTHWEFLTLECDAFDRLVVFND